MNAKLFLFSFTLSFILMLVTYPLWNPAGNRKISFKRWALAALFANATGCLFAILIGNWVLPN